MRSPRVAAAFFAAAALLAAALPGTGRAAGSITSTTYPLAPGVSLISFVDSRGPKHMWALAVTVSSAATIDVATPKAHILAKALTSDMGQAHGATAAVNGDLGLQRPFHPLAQDGALWDTGQEAGFNFAISSDETRAYVGDPAVRVRVLDGPTGPIGVDRWNEGPPLSGEIAGYSPEGGTKENPPGSACSARLLPISAALAWAPAKAGVDRAYTVDAVKCSSTAMVENGGVVISTPNVSGSTEKTEITSLVVGSHVRLRWLISGWPGILDSIGGRQLLVDEVAGVPTNVAPTVCATCSRDPRTGIGISKGCTDGSSACTVYFAIVDGRQSTWSIGMTLSQFANFFIKQLGVDKALALDGGGSTTMWVKASGAFCQSTPLLTSGCLVNKPSDSTGQRQIGSAVVVLPGADTYPSPEPVPTGP